MHLPISNFKAGEERRTYGQLVSANENYIAYIVGKRKIRFLGQSNGEKGLIDTSKDFKSHITSIGLKNDKLAFLSETGELMIGGIYSESKESLGFNPLVSLTFPDLAPSNGLVWSTGSESILAVYGQCQSVFLIWADLKPLGVELPHNLNNNVESVCFYGAGKYVVVSDLEMFECFELDHKTKSFTKIAQLSFCNQLEFARISLFEDLNEEGKKNDFVIGAFTKEKAEFIACPVTVGENLSWITSPVSVDSSFVSSTSITYDPLMKIFLIDQGDGSFDLLGFRSDLPGFAVIKGRWKEPLPVYSMSICSPLRHIGKNIHIPLYTFQSEWVSFYGLRLPKEPTPLSSLEIPSSFICTKKQSQESSPAIYSEDIKDAIKESVKSILLEHLVPSVELAVQEMLKQVKDYLISTQAANTLVLEKKVERLSETVMQLKQSVENLSSLEQASHSSPPVLEDLSAFDIAKRELQQLLRDESPSKVLVKALELGSIDILNWLLPLIDPPTTIEGLDASAHLSLAQQIGSNLETLTEIKLEWLEELFTTFNPKIFGDTIQSVADQVLEDLFANLRIVLAKAPANTDVARKTKLVMKLVKTCM